MLCLHQNNKQALHSLFRNAHVTHMKRTSHSIRSQTMRHVKSYLNGTSIMNLARKCNYPPSMMARLIVENVSSSSFTNKNANNNSANGNETTNSKQSIQTTTPKHTNNNKKKFTTEALRHPEKLLGNASVSILPEYLFSERNGALGTSTTTNAATSSEGGGERKQLVDNFSQLPFYDETEKCNAGSCSLVDKQDVVALSRLSLEVREAVESDPMYGKRRG